MKLTDSPIRTRIAPSPTGIAHVGTAWMSMFDLALAKQSGGQFIVRIEDTDRTRFVEDAEAKIYEAFHWLGIVYDEGGEKGGQFGPYKQSERLEIYQQYIQQLLEKKVAYRCFCTADRLDAMRKEQQKNGQVPRYDRHCFHLSEKDVEDNLKNNLPHVIRLKVPDNGMIGWDDLIREHIEFDAQNVDDQVLMKSDGFPTYHFAVVVDDHLMQITHVLRGEEWISSTPKHILLYQAFDWQPPQFAHMPLIRNADKSKLSKRKNDVSILNYRDKGYLPEALLNFIALLGWSHPEGKEIFSFDEFLRVMSIDRIQKTGPVFDPKKLDWMNGVYIRNMKDDELAMRLNEYLPKDFPSEKLAVIVPLIKDRLITLADIEDLTSFFYREVQHDKALLLKKSNSEDVQDELSQTIAALEKIDEWSVPNLEIAIRSLQETHDWKKSQYFMLVRVAVTGRQATPPLFETMEVIGKEKVIERMREALAQL